MGFTVRVNGFLSNNPTHLGQASSGLVPIVAVDLESDAEQSERRGGDGGVADSHKGIENGFHPLDTVQSEATIRKAGRKRSGMGPLSVSALDGGIG